MRLLITGIIVFLILFYFYLIWPRLSRKRQIRPFLHTMSPIVDIIVLKKGFPKIPYLLSVPLSPMDMGSNWMSI